jgi:hypothetical protein
MTDKVYDEENLLFMQGAKEDVKNFLMYADKSITEKELAAWQVGYLAGAKRAMETKTN